MQKSIDGFKVKKILFILLLITACAAVGKVINPKVKPDGTLDLYVRTNPAGADCVLRNDSHEYHLKTPSYVNVKADGDLKIDCANQGVSKSCALPSYTNYEAEKSDLLTYIGTFKKTQQAEYFAGKAYDSNACLDFDLKIDDGNCDDKLDVGGSDARAARRESVCVDPVEKPLVEKPDNHGKCLIPGAYCLD